MRNDNSRVAIGDFVKALIVLHAQSHATLVTLPVDPDGVIVCQWMNHTMWQNQTHLKTDFMPQLHCVRREMCQQERGTGMVTITHLVQAFQLLSGIHLCT